MSVRNLQHLFAPQSVALIGASARPGSMGATLLASLQGGGFKGKLFAVNPKYKHLGDLPCYASVADLPEAPDLAVICTPAATVPQLVRQLGERGTRAAVVLTSGLARGRDARGRNRA